MNILYGVQATGNGHITRARAMAPALQEQGLNVDYLFSGRSPDKLFDMEPFGDYRCRQGLSFCTERGKIALWPTAKAIKPLNFFRELVQLDVSTYDLIISDFEPITAWAGFMAGVPVVGLGHQYAFMHPIPQHRGSPIARLVTRWFAPAKVRLGLHWHHFDQPILPPIAPVSIKPLPVEKNLYLVYLPFECLDSIRQFLQPFKDYRFAIYHPQAERTDEGHLHFYPPSRSGFHRTMAQACGVIGNAGFGLASEALQIGKKLLIKPLAGQPEQLSNALTLELLELAQTMDKLDPATAGQWLEQGAMHKIDYPDVATAVAQWIAAGDLTSISELANELWRKSSCVESRAFAVNVLGEWLYLPELS
ncbi:MJ1255/VC2487 family glycosyltransferase [Porticoccus sp. GXU_MW_L64]